MSIFSTVLKKDLQQWFVDHPAISIRQFGIEAGWSDGGRFRRYMKDNPYKGELVPLSMMNRISATLKKYHCNLV